MGNMKLTVRTISNQNTNYDSTEDFIRGKIKSSKGTIKDLENFSSKRLEKANSKVKTKKAKVTIKKQQNQHLTNAGIKVTRDGFAKIDTNENEIDGIPVKFYTLATYFYRLVSKTPYDENYFYYLGRKRLHTKDDSSVKMDWELRVTDYLGHTYTYTSDYFISTPEEWNNLKTNSDSIIKNMARDFYESIYDFTDAVVFNLNPRVDQLEYGRYQKKNSDAINVGPTTVHGLTDGYSVQAPKGFIRTTLEEISEINKYYTKRGTFKKNRKQEGVGAASKKFIIDITDLISCSKKDFIDRKMLKEAVSQVVDSGNIWQSQLVGRMDITTSTIYDRIAKEWPAIAKQIEQAADTIIKSEYKNEQEEDLKVKEKTLIGVKTRKFPETKKDIDPDYIRRHASLITRRKFERKNNPVTEVTGTVLITLNKDTDKEQVYYLYAKVKYVKKKFIIYVSETEEGPYTELDKIDGGKLAKYAAPNMFGRIFIPD